MAFIKTVPEAEATGDVQAMYEGARSSLGHLPNYVLAFSQNPAVWNTCGELFRAIRAQMDVRRYELVTVATALAIEGSYCALSHGQVLVDEVLGAEQTAAFARDYRESALTPAEKSMVAFAQKIARRARDVTQADIDELRGHGFTDREITDIAAAVSVRCFMVKFLDAVGSEADPFYADMAPGLRQLLTVGRDIAPRPEGQDGR